MCKKGGGECGDGRNTCASWQKINITGENQTGLQPISTHCFKKAGLDKNSSQIAVVDMDESYTTTWVSTVCPDLLRTAEVNQQSHLAFCLSSQPTVESSGLIWREYWQSVCSLIGLQEQSIQMCLLCPCG